MTNRSLYIQKPKKQQLKNKKETSIKIKTYLNLLD